LMERFARIGVGAGKTFDVATLAPDTKAAIIQGMADAWAEHAALQKRIDAQEVSTGEFFGTREFLKNNYLYRMAGAVYGIYGNSRQEAMYPSYAVDADGQKLDGVNRYIIRFAPDQLPPVNAFWSMTMYDFPAQLMVDNPLNRYLLTRRCSRNSRRMPTAGLRSTFRANPRVPIRRRTGCPRLKGRSSLSCDSTGRRTKRWKASGSSRR
jgi:hypothetical protein